MQTTKDRLAGNRLRKVTDFALAVVTHLTLVGMFGYCKLSDMLRPASQDRV